VNVNWAVVSPSLLLALVALGSLVREWQRDKKHADVDVAEADRITVDKERLRATLESMAEEMNAYRDTRLAQLHGYLYLDAEWHIEVVTFSRMMIELVTHLLGELSGLGVNVAKYSVPREPGPPPAIPIPPPRPVPDPNAGPSRSA
jgi:hypothetical protein